MAVRYKTTVRVLDILSKNGNTIRRDTKSSYNFFSGVRKIFPQFFISHSREFGHISFFVSPSIAKTI